MECRISLYLYHHPSAAIKTIIGIAVTRSARGCGGEERQFNLRCRPRRSQESRCHRLRLRGRWNRLVYKPPGKRLQPKTDATDAGGEVARSDHSKCGVSGRATHSKDAGCRSGRAVVRFLGVLSQRGSISRSRRSDRHWLAPPLLHHHLLLPPPPATAPAAAGEQSESVDEYIRANLANRS